MIASLEKSTNWEPVLNQSRATGLRDLRQRQRYLCFYHPLLSRNSRNSARAEAASFKVPFEPFSVPVVEEAASAEEVVSAPAVPDFQNQGTAITAASALEKNLLKYSAVLMPSWSRYDASVLKMP